MPNFGVFSECGKLRSVLLHRPGLEIESVREAREALWLDLLDAKAVNEAQQNGGLQAMPPHYLLKCLGCGASFEDDGMMLECPHEHPPALLVTEYADLRFEVDRSRDDIYRYRNWLPVSRLLEQAGRSVTFQSQRLNQLLGLKNLWVIFSGYWPERGATLESGTFKELEAYAVLARLPQQRDQVLVLASAGNTAAAFARVCSLYQYPCLIIVPASGLTRLVFRHALDSCVKIVALDDPADYYDAIVLAQRISGGAGFYPEGGIKNVGRRDGLGTAMLSAVETIGRLPEYYFQAIGSGSGGIAAHEAARRLVGDGRLGAQLPRLMLSQNEPFCPIYRSWQRGCRDLVQSDRSESREQIGQIAAGVLSNYQPPYAIAGGVYDVLEESRGDMLVANNADTLAAVALFRECEGIDIDPAAGVALATLVKAIGADRIDRAATIALHITGGGLERRRQTQELTAAAPALEIAQHEISQPQALARLAQLFERYPQPSG